MESNPKTGAQEPVERPRKLEDDEFRTVLSELRQNSEILQTGVLEGIEDRRIWGQTSL